MSATNQLQKSSRKLWLKFALSIVLLLVTALLVVFAVGTAPKLSQIDDLFAAMQTGTSQESQYMQDSTLRLIIGAEGSCYVVGQPVKVWIELVNISKEPQVVMNTLDYRGDGLMGVLPLINGAPHPWLGTALDERRLFPPQADQFATLQPNKMTQTWLEDFWNFAQYYVDKPSPGIYILAVKYSNWFKGPSKLVFKGDKLFVAAYANSNAWTGVLFSNPLTIRIVEKAWQCGPTNANFMAV